MAEKLVRLGIERDPGRMYWVAPGAVWSIPRRQAGDPPARKARVCKVDLDLDLDGYLYFLDAEGDLSRVARKPKPKRRAKPGSRLAGVTPEQLFALLGKPEDAPALRELLTGLGRPRVVRFDDGLQHWCYLRHGLELRLQRGARGRRLSMVYLFARGHQGYSAYPGPLPAGLSFQDRRKDVEARLGRPDRSGEHPAHGLAVDYRGRDRIGLIRLFRRPRK